MILLLHILIALTSVGYTTYVFFAPSSTKLKVSYGLIAATLTSGFYMVWSTPSHMLRGCMMGLLYVGVSSVLVVAAQQKLAKNKE